MRLFDDTVAKDDLPRQPGEPFFSFLNRSNWPSVGRVRDVLQQWLWHYPVAEQNDLVTRFRSSEWVNHSSAFFELLLHELLRLHGCRLTPHPSLPTSNKKVDFLVEESSGYRFYLEATVVDDGPKAKADARLDDLKKRINEQLDNPNFFISLSLHGDIHHPLPSATKIVQFLNERLEGLDPDRAGAAYESGGYETFRWAYEDEEDGFAADFQPIPRSKSVRGTKPQQALGMTTSAFWQANDAQRLQDSIDDKSNRYGELDLPIGWRHCSESQVWLPTPGKDELAVLDGIDSVVAKHLRQQLVHLASEKISLFFLQSSLNHVLPYDLLTEIRGPTFHLSSVERLKV